MNILETIPAELSGYCDTRTGECIVTETGTTEETTTATAFHPNAQMPTTIHAAEGH